MIEVVWFKRDLRVTDHTPLAEASRRGPVLPLYIVEPSLLAADDYDPSHWAFTAACLRELRAALAALGQPLVVRVGEVLPVLQQLHAEHGIARLWSHEETGNAITYQRDRDVGRWARATGIEWNETPNGGVVRRLPNRDGWARRWESRMAAPVVAKPEALRGVPIDPGPIPEARQLGLQPDTRTGAQPGGARAAQALLDSFLQGRGDRYHLEMSSPVTAGDSCSRLSPHLAYGTISTRIVVQQLRAHIAQTADPALRRAWRAFDARLHWRDHFMQKLEDEPAIEHHNFVRGFDGLRENDFDATRFAAWAEGRTGYPMVDACMRCLYETGWINFRMRAMLMSFAAYHLWLHWRPVGLHLARLFVDYDRASIGASAKCNPALPASTRCVSTTPSNRPRITTRTASSSAAGFRNSQAAQPPIPRPSFPTPRPSKRPAPSSPNSAAAPACVPVLHRSPASTAAAKARHRAPKRAPS